MQLNGCISLAASDQNRPSPDAEPRWYSAQPQFMGNRMDWTVASSVSLFIAAVIVWVWKLARRQSTIANYEFSPGLRRKLLAKYPDLSPAEVDRVFLCLRDYFQVCRIAGKHMVAMPSKVVDDAWHEFILFTRDYQRFCTSAFGRYLHHTPAEAMTSPTHADAGVRRTWRIACSLQGIKPDAPGKLPRIFAIDRDLRIDGGYHYELNCKSASQHMSAAKTPYCATHIGCAGAIMAVPVAMSVISVTRDPAPVVPAAAEVAAAIEARRCMVRAVR